MTRLTYGYGLGFRHQRYGPPFVAAFGKYDMSQHTIVSFRRNSQAWLNHREYAVNQPRIDENRFLLLEAEATNYADTVVFTPVYESDNTDFTVSDNEIWVQTKGLTTRWGIITPSREVGEGKFYLRFEFLTDHDFPFPDKVIFSGSKGNKLHFGLNFNASGQLTSLSGANVIHTELIESGTTEDNQRFFIIASNAETSHATSIRFGAYNTTITSAIHKFGLRNIFMSFNLADVKSSWIPVPTVSPVTRATETAVLRRKL